jgi:arginine/lysine/ornithine decarboxylase
LVFSGVQPRWIPPRWDADLHLTHAPAPAAIEDAWNQYPDAAGALVISPTPYGTAADQTAIAEICLRQEPRGWALRVAARRVQLAGSLRDGRRWTDLGDATSWGERR